MKLSEKLRKTIFSLSEVTFLYSNSKINVFLEFGMCTIPTLCWTGTQKLRCNVKLLHRPFGCFKNPPQEGIKYHECCSLRWGLAWTIESLFLFLLLCKGSPVLIYWEISVGITGLETSTLSSCTTCCLLVSPLPLWSRQSHGQFRESLSVPLVSLLSFLIYKERTK